MISSVVSTCKELTSPVSPTPSPSKRVTSTNAPLEHLPLDELYKLQSQHRQHLEFLKEMDMDDMDKKKDVVQKCELVFEIIHSRTASTFKTGVSLTN